MPTTGIALRAVQEDDLPLLAAVEADREAQQMVAFTDTAGELEVHLRRWRKLLDDDRVVKRAVELDGAVVGSVVSFEFDRGTEITYWIAREHWGHGIATRALGQSLAELRVRPLYGRIAFDNIASIQVMERNGFRRIAVERSFARARNATIPEVVYRHA